jgi:hypothetical protein
MDGRDYLFNKYDMRLVIEGLIDKFTKQIDALPAEALSADRETGTLASLEKEHTIYPLVLFPEKTTIDQHEAQVDVRNDPMRFVIDRSRPALVPGFTVTYFVPYTGDKWLWETRSSQFTLNPPSAKVTDSEVVLEYTLPGSDIAPTKGYYDRAVTTIQEWIGFQKGQIDTYNAQLRQKMVSLISSRRNRLQSVIQQAEALGFPAKKKTEPIAEKPPSGDKTKRPSSSGGSSRTYQVALSFAGEDRDYVEKVASKLKEMKISVFYDKFEEANLWGTNLLDYLSNVYGKQSRFVVMFISKHYAIKAWPTVERQSIQARAIRENRIVVLPARFDDTELPGLPSTVAYVDLRAKTPDELAEAIAKKLSGNA